MSSAAGNKLSSQRASSTVSPLRSRKSPAVASPASVLKSGGRPITPLSSSSSRTPSSDISKAKENVAVTVTFSPKRDPNSSRVADGSSSPCPNKNEGSSPPSSSTSTSSAALPSHVGSEKTRNGFAKFFSRTKSGIRLEI